MNPPNGFTYTVNGDECCIEHSRTGMGCLNLFLGTWLTGWTFGCASLIRSYLTGGKMENGEPIPLWFVMAFVGPWFLVAFLLLYSNFARKCFRLTADMLHIETRLLLLKWTVSIPRGTITEIQQIKDGGEGDDSFPSWGLKIRSSAFVNTLAHRLILFNNFGRTNRMRSILARLPYDQSEWLATILSKWSGVTAFMCPKPESEPRKAPDS
ncbi:MAG: hypothetical protein ACK5T6_10715 [Pirellula sp.]|jgi:hypothetical protein